jgi:hypothetical protein
MEREGAAQVWNNAAYVDFRRRLDEGPPPDVCRSCAIYAGTF